MTDTAHPLDGEDVLIEVSSSFLEHGYTATARHAATGLVGEGAGDSETDAVAEARDALLKLLEEAGGC